MKKLLTMGLIVPLALVAFASVSMATEEPAQQNELNQDLNSDLNSDRTDTGT